MGINTSFKISTVTTMRCLIVLLSLAVASTLASDEFGNDWRVIGGEDAPDGEYPHIISLKHFNGHRCGGSIVHEEWVLTAAHCVENLSAENLRIVAGSNLLNSGGDSYQVLEIHVHNLYNPFTLLNDIAILKVEKIKFGVKVGKINIEKTYVDGGVSVIISGWGRTTPEGSGTNVLQHLTYNTTTGEECKKRVTTNPIDPATQICTLHRSGIGGCFGDSGSPLIRTVDGVRFVVGAVSWGPQCGSGYYPDVFTRVSGFASWLNEKCKCNL